MIQIGFLATICLLSSVERMSAQEFESPWLGKHFFVALPDTLMNTRGKVRPLPDRSPELILFSLEETTVRVSGPSGSRTLQLRPDASQLLLFSDFFPAGTTPYLDKVGIPIRKTIEIQSEKDIWVYCRFISPFGSEMFSPMPVEKWGSEYRAGTLPNNLIFNIAATGVDPVSGGIEEGFSTLSAPGEFLVIASEDDTQVMLTAKVGLSSGSSLRLNRGEAALLQAQTFLLNPDSIRNDLAGALIRADKPIGVISGNTRSPGGAGAERVANPSVTTNSGRNSVADWLLPVTSLGNTFVYTPMLTEFSETEELIRLVATEPGTTVVTTSFGGPPQSIAQGEFLEFSSLEWRPGSVPSPFVLFSNQPVMAYAISGSWIDLLFDSASYTNAKSWSPAMSILPPVDHWLNVGRCYAFPLPASVDQYLLLAAEENATVSLDGRELKLESIAATGFKWGRFKVSGGDHTVLSTGGTFSGIFYGIRYGYESFRVPGIGSGDGKGSKTTHFAEYDEDLSIAWATPIAGGRLVGEPEPDSLKVSSRDFCDSTVVIVDRISENIWLLGPMNLEFESGSVNTRMVVDTVAGLGPVLGYRVTLLPIDPTADASATLVVRATGVEKRISFNYAGTMVTLPLRIDFGTGLTAGAEYRQTIVMTNRRSFTATVIDAAIEKGTEGFSIDDGGQLPRPLQSGQNVSVDLVFNATTPGKTWRDTLLVFTDCGTYRVPLEGRTSGTAPLKPEPTITGYDWRTRSIGTQNDTLSFAGNIGTKAYRIREVQILSTGPTPFSLISPRENRDSVRPGDRLPLGIRFAPTVTGSFLDTILLITDDGDSAFAELIGRAIDTSGGLPRLDGTDIQVPAYCLGDRLDTFLLLRNPGTATTTVTSLQVIRSTNGTAIFPSPGLPRTIPPGGSVQIPVQFQGTGLGAFEILIGVDTGSGGEGIVLKVTGIALDCEPPALVVNDHDFGTIWITTEKGGSVMLKNVGRGDVGVLNARLLNDPENSFTYLTPSPPFTVLEGDSIEVYARFSPPTKGEKRGAIIFETEIGDLRSNLIGVGKKLVIPAFIRRDYKGMPGEEVVIDVELEAPADSVYPEEISYVVRFADELLDPLGAVAEDGIDVPELGSGTVSGSIHRPADSLLGEGTILSLRFLTRLSLLESTELPFELQADRPWIEFDERPGLFVKQPICGLEYRLFEFTRFGLSIGSPQPNPASDVAGFAFEIPFDGVTRIVIYDLLGFERLTVIDQFLVAGTYDLSIPVSLLPVGTYILHFQSGTFSATRQLDVLR
ncbi:MAG: hypothetical protein AB7H80_11925 [Candidatus Kapaibacterium sp.]